MAKLIYTAIASLDGFIEDAEGGFEWAAPDDEVHRFANDLEANVGTHLFGRRMYDTMAVWQDIDASADVPTIEAAYAELWRSADKVVYSRTLDAVWTPRTELVRSFDPAAVARLKASSERDISIGGPTLAQHAFTAGLVDEVHLIVVPVLAGGGKAALPAAGRANLALIDTDRFANGTVHLHYRLR